jgi:hypothetical protein
MGIPAIDPARSRRRCSAVPVNNQPIWPQLDEPDLVESGDDGVQMPVEQGGQGMTRGRKRNVAWIVDRMGLKNQRSSSSTA